MATFDNNLRIKEIATGDESGTWGTSTNTNLSLISDALGYATEATFDTDADKTVTVGDATASPYRSMYVKVTSSATLSAARTLTIGPNTIKRVMFIENATTGNQYINVSQGSGANASIPNGAVMCVFLDGAGGSAAVASVFHNFVATDFIQIKGSTPSLLIGEAEEEDTRLVFNGNAINFYIGLDDSSDKLILGDGASVGSNNILTFEDNTVTLGDGSAADTKLVFDGNAGDFHVGLDDSSDNLVLGAGTTLGAEPRVEIDKDGGVQIISDAPVNGQLKLSDIGDNADHGILRHDSGVLSLISTQAADTVGSVAIKGQSTSGTFTYITFASSGTTTDKDIEITTSSASKSIILRSPNGSRFRITVDNSGNLATAAV